MAQESKQFEDFLEEWTPEERVWIEQMRSAYRNEMPESIFSDFKRDFWHLHYETAANLQYQISASVGSNRAANESALLNFYFRTAQILADGGFIADSIEFLDRRRDELRDSIRERRAPLVSQTDIVLKRFSNAIEAYRERLIPQYIRDVDAEKPSLSEFYTPHGLRSMMLSAQEG